MVDIWPIISIFCEPWFKMLFCIAFVWTCGYNHSSISRPCQITLNRMMTESVLSRLKPCFVKFATYKSSRFVCHALLWAQTFFSSSKLLMRLFSVWDLGLGKLIYADIAPWFWCVVAFDWGYWNGISLSDRGGTRCSSFNWSEAALYISTSLFSAMSALNDSLDASAADWTASFAAAWRS